MEKISGFLGFLGLVEKNMPSDPEPTHRACSASTRDDIKCFIASKLVLTVVVLGASGDLAKKKTFPALFTLFKRGYVNTITCLDKSCLYLLFTAESSVALTMRVSAPEFLLSLLSSDDVLLT